MNATTFELDLHTNVQEIDRISSLLITDASLLYGDIARVTRMLDHALAVGVDSEWHIVTDLSLGDAVTSLLPILETYVETSRNHHGIRLEARLLGTDSMVNEVLGRRMYPYRGMATIYTAGYWSRAVSPDYSAWGYFLESQLGITPNDRMLSVENLEAALAFGARSDRQSLAVVTADPQAHSRYSLRGFGFESVSA